MSTYRQTITVVVESDEPITPETAADGSIPGRAVGPIAVTDRFERHRVSPEPNRRELIRLATWASGEYAKSELGLPSEWDQGSWFTLNSELAYAGDVPTVTDKDGTACGTQACMAGKVALDFGAEPGVNLNVGWGDPEFVRLSDPRARTELYDALPLGRVFPPGSDEPVSVSEFAKEKLGLTGEQATRLFAGDNSLETILEIIRDVLEAEPEYEDVPLDAEEAPVDDQDLTAPDDFDDDDPVDAWVEGERYPLGTVVTHQGDRYKMTRADGFRTSCGLRGPADCSECWTKVVEPTVVPKWEARVLGYAGRDSLGGSRNDPQQVAFQGRIYNLSPSTICAEEPTEHDVCWTPQA